MTENEFRAAVYAFLSDRIVEGDVLTDFVLVVGFVSSDEDGVLIESSAGTPGYTQLGLLESAVDSVNHESRR